MEPTLWTAGAKMHCLDVTGWSSTLIRVMFTVELELIFFPYNLKSYLGE